MTADLALSFLYLLVLLLQYSWNFYSSESVELSQISTSDRTHVSRALPHAPFPFFLCCSVNSDRSRHPPRLCCKALRFGSCAP